MLYVGDHPKDVQAASAAGAVRIGVRWGYIPVEHPIETWNADIVINHPDEILKSPVETVTRKEEAIVYVRGTSQSARG